LRERPCRMILAVGVRRMVATLEYVVYGARSFGRGTPPFAELAHEAA
jgi:hypothetical protein